MDSRLARRLGVGDAVVVGLGSMLGAGVFTAFGPAARAAGAGIAVALALAGLVAWCNATSSAALAAVHPESARRRAPRPGRRGGDLRGRRRSRPRPSPPGARHGRAAGPPRGGRDPV